VTPRTKFEISKFESLEIPNLIPPMKARYTHDKKVSFVLKECDQSMAPLLSL
jgi:hypothetical protein